MEQLKEIFEKIVPGLRDIFGDQLVRIVLYGSAARGTNTEESDVDIAVFIHGYTEKMHDSMVDLTVELELEYDKVLSVLLINYEEFVEWEKVVPFYKNVKNEGIVLWSIA